mmetsp:Transcript_17470/g.36664  ORF Transcript_17470/g.36664 Transcript_17470/m.36664 type:complete len:83 (-) Transcript_17470:2220-2468(-)
MMCQFATCSKYKDKNDSGATFIEIKLSNKQSIQRSDYYDDRIKEGFLPYVILPLKRQFQSFPSAVDDMIGLYQLVEYPVINL